MGGGPSSSCEQRRWKCCGLSTGRHLPLPRHWGASLTLHRWWNQIRSDCIRFINLQICIVWGSSWWGRDVEVVVVSIWKIYYRGIVMMMRMMRHTFWKWGWGCVEYQGPQIPSAAEKLWNGKKNFLRFPSRHFRGSRRGSLWPDIPSTLFWEHWWKSQK